MRPNEVSFADEFDAIFNRGQSAELAKHTKIGQGSRSKYYLQWSGAANRETTIKTALLGKNEQKNLHWFSFDLHFIKQIFKK